MKMDCISITFRRAPLALRQRFAFLQEAAESILEKSTALEGVEQCVLLVTCNRTELYVKTARGNLGDLEELLAQEAGVDGEQVRKIERRYQGKAAVEHLFRVTCGMDSMVLGEDEILGQVRRAYKRAVKAGCVQKELHLIFQAALACAKRVKTETLLSKTPVSVATLAAKEVFGLPGDTKTVLLIGASGQIGGTILKNLLGHGRCKVIATVRSHRIEAALNDSQVERIAYRERYRCLDRVDAVISATKSPHYTITACQAKAAMETKKCRLFIDVAIPADVDESVGGLEGRRLVRLDDFWALAKENNHAKEMALVDVEEILQQELDTLYKKLLLRAFSERNPGWESCYAGLCAQKLLYRLRDRTDSEVFAKVLEALEE